ncbi:hypothetical protein [Novosphingobium cyanobacteriorum]|uniref:Uncharacterized protein n=1 Tax=Novosphingobium cyanobacteriorum TaxID=3024215 RepID=A0ABT6CGD3_9SPHN|nr:hypothetical protein [Novosphingobium cyanobacteriorum]MDF8332990.1 hypothetical protein [Novosphingobium cyanobacteriorum]
MDLNQLYFDHQLQLMRARSTPCASARLRHRESAGRIAHAIATVHRASGAAALRQWEA